MRHLKKEDEYILKLCAPEQKVNMADSRLIVRIRQNTLGFVIKLSSTNIFESKSNSATGIAD